MADIVRCRQVKAGKEGNSVNFTVSSAAASKPAPTAAALSSSTATVTAPPTKLSAKTVASESSSSSSSSASGSEPAANGSAVVVKPENTALSAKKKNPARDAGQAITAAAAKLLAISDTDEPALEAARVEFNKLINTFNTEMKKISGKFVELKEVNAGIPTDIKAGVTVADEFVRNAAGIIEGANLLGGGRRKTRGKRSKKHGKTRGKRSKTHKKHGKHSKTHKKHGKHGKRSRKH